MQSGSPEKLQIRELEAECDLPCAPSQTEPPALRPGRTQRFTEIPFVKRPTLLFRDDGPEELEENPKINSSGSGTVRTEGSNKAVQNLPA